MEGRLGGRLLIKHLLAIRRTMRWLRKGVELRNGFAAAVCQYCHIIRHRCLYFLDMLERVLKGGRLFPRFVTIPDHHHFALGKLQIVSYHAFWFAKKRSFVFSKK